MRITDKHPQTSSHYRLWLSVIVICCFVAAIGYMVYTDFFQPLPALAPIKQPVASTPEDRGEPKTVEEKARYTVPASHPRELSIDTLGVNANILSLGTLSDGALDAPKTAWDVGWYNQSALPGSGSGALIIDGHVNDALNMPGVFSALHTLKPGDTMKIERGDGEVVVYKAVSVEQTPTEHVDMAKLLRPITPGKEGLNLITCGGQYDRQRKTYIDRIIAYAERIS